MAARGYEFYLRAVKVSHGPAGIRILSSSGESKIISEFYRQFETGLPLFRSFTSLMSMKWQFSRKITLKISSIKIKITTLHGRKSFNDCKTVT